MDNNRTVDTCLTGERNYESILALQKLVSSNATQIAVINKGIEALTKAMADKNTHDERISVLEEFKKSYEEKHKRLFNTVVVLACAVIGAIIQGYMTMPIKH